MTTIASSRPIGVKAPVKPAPGHDANVVADYWINRNAIDVVRTGASVGQMAGRAFTPPVIVDVVKGSLRSGISASNLAWQVIPSAIANVRNVTSGKVSVGRGVANVLTDTGFGITKGIVSGILVQSLSIATGPVLGLLPIAPTLLPFVGIGVGLLGLGASYLLMNKLVRSTGIEKTVSDALTKVFGGDKNP